MQWMRRCYSRLLIDNHITDIDPSLMRRFDPAEYLRMTRMAGVDSAMIYACCHNGNCYYPTKVGHQHANLDGRDIFGETVELMNRSGIVPIAYYTVIYHNDSAKRNPSWRARDVKGSDHHGRYWFSCPNNPEYVDFANRQLAEIAAYDVAGVFIDMTFWPMVCLCDNCKAKYRAENGAEIPTTVDWSSPEWVSFQRSRERWMAEFAATLTDHVRKAKPGISVTHQFSPVLHGWFLGQSSGIAAASDYASGDFYGGKIQHRLGAKVFAAYSKNAPYEFMTSRCVNLHDHTSTKSEEELLLHAATTLANGGAYFFIDAINPDGTLNEKVYQRLGRVTARLKPFKDCVQRHVPVLAADCGLYFSMSSAVNESSAPTSLDALAESGSNMENSRDNPSLREIVGTATVLSMMKRPYKVVTDTTADLSGLKTLIINNAVYMSAEEVARVRQFVNEGGTLIATGLTSLRGLDGTSSGDFQLSDVLGVSFTGERTDTTSYLSIDGEMVSCSGRAPLVTAPMAEPLGHVAQTLFPCNDPERYASIHSNPPGSVTRHPGLTINSYGKGKAIYHYSSLLVLRQDSQQQFAMALFAKHLGTSVITADGLPPCVEVTLLRSSTVDALLLCLVNQQEELPGVPLRDLHLRVRPPRELVVKKARRISNASLLPFSEEEGMLSFTIDRLDDIEMIELS